MRRLRSVAGVGQGRRHHDLLVHNANGESGVPESTASSTTSSSSSSSSRVGVPTLADRGRAYGHAHQHQPGVDDLKRVQVGESESAGVSVSVSGSATKSRRLERRAVMGFGSSRPRNF